MLFSNVERGCIVSAHAELPLVLVTVLRSSCIVKPSTGLWTALRLGIGSSSGDAPSLWLTSTPAIVRVSKMIFALRWNAACAQSPFAICNVDACVKENSSGCPAIDDNVLVLPPQIFVKSSWSQAIRLHCLQRKGSSTRQLSSDDRGDVQCSAYRSVDRLCARPCRTSELKRWTWCFTPCRLLVFQSLLCTKVINRLIGWSPEGSGKARVARKIFNFHGRPDFGSDHAAQCRILHDSRPEFELQRHLLRPEATVQSKYSKATA